MTIVIHVLDQANPVSVKFGDAICNLNCDPDEINTSWLDLDNDVFLVAGRGRGYETFKTENEVLAYLRDQNVPTPEGLRPAMDKLRATGNKANMVFTPDLMTATDYSVFSVGDSYSSDKERIEECSTIKEARCVQPSYVGAWKYVQIGSIRLEGRRYGGAPIEDHPDLNALIARENAKSRTNAFI